MKYSAALFFAALLVMIGSRATAQTFNYTQGSLQIAVFVSNPCNGSSNGFIRYTVLATGDGNPGKLQVILGPVNFFGPQSIPVGGSFVFNAGNTLSAGLYNFILADNTGTDVINTFPASGVTLTALPNLSINQVTLTNNSDCSSPNGQAVGSISGGSQALGSGGSYTYTWSSSNGLSGLPLTNNNFSGVGNLDLAALLGRSGLPGGTYTLTVQDNYSSCSATKNFTITDPLPNLYSITSGSGSVCAGSNFTVTLSGSDGPVPAPGTNYEILRNGSSTGLIFAGTGASPFNMAFSTVGFSSGDVITVRATNGSCSPRIMTGSVTLTLSSAPTAATLSGNATICAGQSTNISVAITGGTAPYSFTITGFGLVSGYASGSPISVSPASSTVYTLSGNVTDANGCTVVGTGTASITVNPIPTATISASPASICPGSNSTLTFTLTGTGPFNVTYSDGSSSFNLVGISTGHTVSVSPAITKTYTITSVSDATSCSGVAGSNTTVTVNPPITAANLVAAGLTTICAGASTTIQVNITGGTPNFSFPITNGPGQAGYVSGTPITVSPATTTTYDLTGLTVTDSKGCTIIGSGSVTITVNPAPTATISSSPGAICPGGSSTLTFTLTGTPPFNVSYTDGVSIFNLTGIANGHTVSVSPASTTNYSITSVTDANTCSGVAGSNTSVVVNTPPSSAVLSGDNTICSGSSTNLIVTITGGASPYSFTINNGVGAVSSYTSGSPIAVSPSSTAVYSIVGNVTDANGCTVAGSGTATITILPAATPTLTGPASSCQGTVVNYATDTGMSGYNWVLSAGGAILADNGDNIDMIWTTAGPQTVSVSYTDVSGCTSTTSVLNVSVANMTVTPTIVDNTNCVAPFNGSITLAVSGALGTPTYSWTSVGGFTSTSQNITNLPADSYDITVTDPVSGCVVSYSGLVVNSNPPTININIVSQVDNDKCTAPFDGALNISTSGSVGVPTFSWTGPGGFTSTSQNISALNSGNYTVTVTDPSTGCTASLPITVNDITPSISPSTTPVDNTNCAAPFSGSITTTVSGGGPTYTYAWTGPSGFTATTQNISGLQAGSYDVTVTDVTSGCTGTLTGTVINNVFTPITADISGSATVCSGQSTNLTFTLTGAGPTFDVTYTDGTSNFVASGISSGGTVAVSPSSTVTYTIVSVKDNGSGCVLNAPDPSITGSAAITVTPGPTGVIAGTTTICNGQSATLTFTLPAGTFDVVFTDGTSNFTLSGISSGATTSVSPTASTTYTLVSVQDNSSGCIVTAPSASLTGSAIITVNPVPTGSIAGTTTICSGQSATLTFTLPAGAFDVVFTDGTSNFTLSGISSGATTSVSPVANTTYTLVSVQDNSTGCLVSAPSASLTGSAIITINPAPSGSISGTTSICNGQSATLTFTLSAGTFDVVFTDGTSNFTLSGIASGATTSVSPSSSTTYSLVSVTDNSTSCSVTAPSPSLTGTAVITVTPTPTASIAGTTTICNGQSATLTFTLPAGTFDVVFTDGTSNFTLSGISSGATTSVTPSTTTTYSLVSVQDNSSGCIVTAPSAALTGSAVITVNPLPTASISGPSSLCSGQSATLTFTLPAGTFDVVYTDGTSNFTLSGISSGATASVSPAVNTTYTIVSVTDNASSCVVTAPSANITGSVAITVVTVSIVSISTVDATCLGVNDGVIQINSISGGSAPYQYSIDNGATFQFSNTFSGLVPATYQVVAKDKNGCTSAASNATINSGVTILPTTSSTNATCIGTSDGSITVTSVAGGSAPYTYSIDNGVTFQASNNFLSLAAGSYNIIVKDKNGCLSTPQPVSVGSNTSITFTTTPTNASCVGISDGQIAVGAPTGGTGPYTYSDDNGVTFQASSTFSGLAPGIYQVVVKDAGGCLSLAVPTTVGSNTTISITTVNHTDATCSGVNDGTITVAAVSGGTAPYSYSIDNGVTFVAGNSFSSLAPNTYQVVAKDAAGCTSSATPVTVGSGSTITITTSKVDATCGGNSDGSITVSTVTGGSPAYSYSSDGGTTFQASNVLSGLAANTYSIVVKDNGGCLSTPVSVTINNSVSITPNIVKNDATCAANDGSIVIVSVSGGASPYTYSINNGVSYQGSNSFTSLAIGTYQVIVKDNNGCLSTMQSFVVSKPGSCGGVNCGAFTIVATDTRPTCNNQNNGTITISVSGGTPNYIVTLSDPSISFNQAQAGAGLFTYVNLSPSLTYQYTIQDAAGNTCTLPYSLPINSTVQASAAGFVDATCYNQPVGQATVTVTSGGTSPYAYSLDNGVTWTAFTSPHTITNLMPAAAPYAILVADDPSDPCPAQVLVTINNANTPITLSGNVITPATCANDDGTIQIGTIAGGVSPYTYRFDSVAYASLPPSNTFTALASGPHKFTVIDAIGCEKYFTLNVTSPGYVNFFTQRISPSCTGNGGDGKIRVTVVSSGNFDIGITTDPVNPPTKYKFTSISNLSTPVTFDSLSQGTYRIVVKPNGALCTTDSTEVINGGPKAVSVGFKGHDFICFETKGIVDLFGISGSPVVPYTYELSISGTVILSGSIPASVQPTDTIHVTNVDKGNYQLRLYQDQSGTTGCATPISTPYKSLTINGPSAALDTLFVTKQYSLPSVPTGSMLIGIQESGEQPYRVMLTLLNPRIQGQTNNNIFDTQFVKATRDPVSNIVQFNATGLYAGDYRLTIADTLGCVKTYDILLDFSKEIFIPNIFTPNNDGKNDYFEILNLPDNSNIIISNRWGKQVFSGSNFQVSADGITTIVWNGGAESDGIYYYNLTAGGKTYTGWVEILHPTN